MVVEGGVDHDPIVLQDSLVAAIKAYVAHLDEDRDLPPFRRGQLTQTEAALVASRVLRSAEIELFELSIFESWYH